MEKILSQTLAQYICRTTYDTLPEEVRKKAISCISDYIGCIYAGSTLPIHKELINMLREDFTAGKVPVIGSDFKADPVTAALINGATASNMALDDIYSAGIYHPAVTAVTAAISIAGKKKVTGKEFITAVVLGYEITMRMSAACNPSHYKHWHTSSTVGSYCAAIVASKLLGCTEEETIFALGLAGTQAGGSQECLGNDAQFLHLGFASRNGVLAALMAKRGLTGAKRILDGPAGFFAAMSAFKGNIHDVFVDLGKQYLILINSFKMYPCCGHIFAVIDGGLILKQMHNFSPDEILSVEVGTYQTALTNSGNPDPQNVQEAQFSIAYVVSVALVQGEFGIRQYENWPPSPEITKMLNKVKLYRDQEAEDRFPAARGATVTVHTKNGAFTEARKFRKGDPEWPLTHEEISQKFRTLISYAKAPEEIQKVEKALENFAELDDAIQIIV